MPASPCKSQAELQKWQQGGRNLEDVEKQLFEGAELRRLFSVQENRIFRPDARLDTEGIDLHKAKHCKHRSRTLVIET